MNARATSSTRPVAKNGVKFGPLRKDTQLMKASITPMRENTAQYMKGIHSCASRLCSETFLS